MQLAIAIAVAVLGTQVSVGVIWWCWRASTPPLRGVAQHERDPAFTGNGHHAPCNGPHAPRNGPHAPCTGHHAPFTLSEPRSGESKGAPADRPTTAVVLVHGFLGFGSLGIGRARIHYFRRVARRLEARGLDVTVARLPALGGTPARGHALLAHLDRLSHDHVVIVAHSLGGLDARWALANGGAGRVRAVVTIGTPHHGTPIADAFARGPAAALRRALARLGLGSDAIDWLTTERLVAFNRDTPDVPGVTYASIVAATADGRRVHPLLRPTHAFLAAHGPSDGVVPGWSQAWGNVIATAEIDHWAQVGWSSGYDAAALVERALESVRALPPAVAPYQLAAAAVAADPA